MEKIISSTSNPYVKHLKKLQTSSKYRSDCGTFVLEGQRPVRDAMSYGIVPEKILVSESYKGKTPEGDVCIISDRVAEFVSDTKTPQGIMAEIRMPKPDTAGLNPDKSPLLFFCDGVSDPGNLGTIIRTLVAAGASGLVLGQGSVDLYNPKTVRSTMASLFDLPVYHAGETAAVLSLLKKKGYRIIGTRMENATDYTRADFTVPTVVIMGNEARGMSEAAINACDGFVKIPIVGKIESLNVAIASGIIAYEAYRQRNK